MLEWRWIRGSWSIDRNADGKLTSEELAARSGEAFGKMDGDRDGSLNRNEIQIAHDIMMPPDE
ncbi:MAG: hypothetical protein EHM84_00085 [Lysobacterales bacterium]|nr:MAG: hypothetical protein EHM84_00085 [Xanthomonadales bacterium]